MMHCGIDPAGTFKTMAEVSNKFDLTSNSEDTENTSIVNDGGDVLKMRLSFSSEKDFSPLDETDMSCKHSSLQRVSDSDSFQPGAEVGEQLSPATVNTRLKAKNTTDMKVSPEHNGTKQNSTEDKENTAVISPGRQRHQCWPQYHGYSQHKPWRCFLLTLPIFSPFLHLRNRWCTSLYILSKYTIFRAEK